MLGTVMIENRFTVFKDAMRVYGGMLLAMAAVPLILWGISELFFSRETGNCSTIETATTRMVSCPRMSLDGNILIVLIGALMLIAMVPLYAGPTIVLAMYGLDGDNNEAQFSVWETLRTHPTLLVTVPLGVVFYYTPFVLLYAVAVQLNLVVPMPFCEATPIIVLCPSG